MKTKRIILLAIFVMTGASGVFAQKHDRGEMGVSSVGGIVGYAIENNTLTVGVDYRYNVGERLRLAPSLLYTIENENISTMYFNADAHYLARITKQTTLYPIAGIGVSNWREPSTELPDLTSLAPADSVSNSLRVGLNFGFGCESRISKDIIIGAEFRYNLVVGERYRNQAMIVARIAYYY